MPVLYSIIEKHMLSSMVSLYPSLPLGTAVHEKFNTIRWNNRLLLLLNATAVVIVNIEVVYLQIYLLASLIFLLARTL